MLQNRFDNLEYKCMKTDDAYKIFGFNDRVLDMFLISNTKQISSFCREILMQGKFYCLPVDKLAEYLAKELIWQDEVYNAYQKHLVNQRHSPDVEIQRQSEFQW